MEPDELLFVQAKTGGIQQDPAADASQLSEATSLPPGVGKRVYICKQTVLRHALQSLSLRMHGSRACAIGDGQIIGSVSIDVPPHGQYLVLHERKFYGDYKLTEEDALESASLAALLYLQKSGIIIVDDVNLGSLTECEAMLADCQHRLLAASSWTDMFVERAECLQAKLDIAKKANEEFLHMPKWSLRRMSQQHLRLKRHRTKLQMLRKRPSLKQQTTAKLAIASRGVRNHVPCPP